MRALTLGSVLLLAGCVQAPLPEPAPTSENSTAITTLSPSTTRALPARDDVGVAVVEDLSQYLAATDDITSDGGLEPERIQQLVTADWAATETEGFAGYVDGGLRTVGRTTARHLTVQSVRWVEQGLLEVALFACIDSTGVAVFPDALEPPEMLEVWLAGVEEESDVGEADEAEVALFLELPEVRLGRRDPVLAWFVGPNLSALSLDRLDTWRGHHPCAEQ